MKEERSEDVRYVLAAKAAAHDFVLVSDVASQAGGSGEGALALVTGKLLQGLCSKRYKHHTHPNARALSHVASMVHRNWTVWKPQAGSDAQCRPSQKGCRFTHYKIIHRYYFI